MGMTLCNTPHMQLFLSLTAIKFCIQLEATFICNCWGEHWPGNEAKVDI